MLKKKTQQTKSLDQMASYEFYQTFWEERTLFLLKLSQKIQDEGMMISEAYFSRPALF